MQSTTANNTTSSMNVANNSAVNLMSLAAEGFRPMELHADDANIPKDTAPLISTSENAAIA